MSKLIEFGGKFPWFRARENVYVASPVAQELRTKQWVILPDGRPGVVDHTKPDGTLGVKPVNPLSGEFYPNLSEHWSMEDRWRIPEEIAIPADKVRMAEKHEIPRFAHAD